MAVIGTAKISFHSLEDPSWLKYRTHLKEFIVTIFKSEKRSLNHLSVIFCSDNYLLQINSEYLKHNTYTDIITFDLSNHLPGITGEIYISLERIRENSALYHTSLSDELRRVIFHGVLHLCGYKDKTAAQKKIMRSKEDHYLRKLVSSRST